MNKNRVQHEEERRKKKKVKIIIIHRTEGETEKENKKSGLLYSLIIFIPRIMFL